MKSEVHLIDCMEFMRSCKDKQFDLAVVDPPYGIGISSNPVRQMHSKKKWDNSTPNDEYFNELFRVSKNQIIWGGNYFGLPASQGFLIWDKKQPEDFSLAMCEYAWSSFQSPAKMLRLSVQSEQNKIHPTQKPVALYDWIFRNYAKPNDTILDTHMGSQSSRISAYKAGLDYTGCELDPEYFEQGNHRFNEFLKKYGTPDPTKAIHGQQINLF
jgi:site-specific DNA-methyltransferase (adenine-specific)